MPTFTDSVDANNAPANNDKCGTKSFSILKSDGQAVPSFLTLNGSTLSLQSDTVGDIGTHSIVLTVAIDGTSITREITFDAIIDPCVP